MRPLPPKDDHQTELLSRRMRRLAVHLVRDEASADDLVQEAWLVALAPNRNNPDSLQENKKPNTGAPVRVPQCTGA